MAYVDLERERVAGGGESVTPHPVQSSDGGVPSGRRGQRRRSRRPAAATDAAGPCRPRDPCHDGVHRAGDPVVGHLGRSPLRPFGPERTPGNGHVEVLDQLHPAPQHGPSHLPGIADLGAAHRSTLHVLLAVASSTLAAVADLSGTPRADDARQPAFEDAAARGFSHTIPDTSKWGVLCVQRLAPERPIAASTRQLSSGWRPRHPLRPIPRSVREPHVVRPERLWRRSRRADRARRAPRPQSTWPP